MSDNWNLKDKEFEPYESGIKRWVYSKEDIETLRQKLIDDLKIQCPEDQIEIEYIINKRFGVKENEDNH